MMQIPQETQRPEHWPPETERCSNTSDMFQEENTEKPEVAHNAKAE
ncbi:MAG: hypothetical protein K6L74_16830 [Neptuniibacter sp.]